MSRIFTATLARGDLSMVYQPIIPINARVDDDVDYFEALLRVKEVSPIAFLNRLNAADYFKLDLWVAQQIAKQDNHSCYAINLSPFSFANRELINLLLLSKHCFVLEIVEHYAFTLDQSDLLTEICRQFPVLLDDIGAGYSSLNRLCSFDFKGIKIDGSLILMLEKSRKARAIVASLMLLSQELNMSCVCECVETLAIWELLKEAHATYAPKLDLYVQGWAVGKPRTAIAIN